MNAPTPADLGVRSQLLVDKHAAYIGSFSNVWEVWHTLSVARSIQWCLNQQAIITKQMQPAACFCCCFWLCGSPLSAACGTLDKLAVAVATSVADPSVSSLASSS
jgi:hypothetical protein